MRAEEAPLFLVMSPKQQRAGCTVTVSPEMLILLNTASVLFIFLHLVLEKHVYFLLGWPCTCMIEMLICKCAMT